MEVNQQQHAGAARNFGSLDESEEQGAAKRQCTGNGKEEKKEDEKEKKDDVTTTCRVVKYVPTTASTVRRIIPRIPIPVNFDGTKPETHFFTLDGVRPGEQIKIQQVIGYWNAVASADRYGAALVERFLFLDASAPKDLVISIHGKTLRTKRGWHGESLYEAALDGCYHVDITYEVAYDLRDLAQMAETPARRQLAMIKIPGTAEPMKMFADEFTTLAPALQAMIDAKVKGKQLDHKGRMSLDLMSTSGLATMAFIRMLKIGFVDFRERLASPPKEFATHLTELVKLCQMWLVNPKAEQPLQTSFMPLYYVVVSYVKDLFGLRDDDRPFKRATTAAMLIELNADELSEWLETCIDYGFESVSPKHKKQQQAEPQYAAPTSPTYSPTSPSYSPASPNYNIHD